LDELLLIEKLKQGDETAFRQIVESWQSMVYNTAIGILQNAEDAEDVAQEVFVQVFESIGSFKAEAKFSTWLYRITVSKALDHLRKKKRKKRRLLSLSLSLKRRKFLSRKEKTSKASQLINYAIFLRMLSIRKITNALRRSEMNSESVTNSKFQITNFKSGHIS